LYQNVTLLTRSFDKKRVGNTRVDDTRANYLTSNML